jgi:calcium permeable stress-gated cation channel
VYAKALKHTLVGCYLSVVCLIGLFAIKTGSDTAALGPLVLMIIFLIFMILYHISLNAAIEPLLHFLPRSLEAEEEALLGRAEEGTRAESLDGTMREKNGVASEAPTKVVNLGPAPHAKPSMIKKFLRPDIYTDYATMRRLVPHDFTEIKYDPEIEAHAYQHPAVVDRAPLLWIPKDSMGVSSEEIAHTDKIIPITDEGAFFNESGKIVWDMDTGRPPVYEDKVYY